MSIYHSPQHPGYTCWCGLWNMPDHSVMCSFHQATGPIEGRPKAPADVRTRLSWPPLWHEHGEAYDMTGLDFELIHLRSFNYGESWETVGSEHFQTCVNGWTCEAETALADGSILRGVWGPYLPYDEVPRTGYLQRSVDGGVSWSGPQLFHDRPGVMVWPRRIRQIRDGRLLMGCGLYFTEYSKSNRDAWSKDMTQAIFVSEDGGTSWQGPIHSCPERQRREFAGEEFDFAELPNGDLLLSIRAETQPGFDTNAPGQSRRQTRLVRKGHTWEPTRVDRVCLPPSGQPELLTTREGVILHVATTGISWTDDDGAHWTDFALAPPSDPERWTFPGTPYYPRAVQMADGEILCVGHVGGDNAYGVVDQSIAALRFAIEVP